MNAPLDSNLDLHDEIVNAIGLERYEIGILDRPGMPSFSDLVGDAISGRLDLSFGGIFSAVTEIVFAEFLAHGGLIRQLIIIAILGALMSVLTETFRSKSAGETGFYVTYLMAVLPAIASFYIAVEILNGLVGLTDGIMQAAIPLMFGLMAMGGNFTGAASLNPLLFMGLQAISWYISSIFVPLVLMCAALDIIGQLSINGSDGNKLEKPAEFLRKIASWSLKGILATFAFLLTLQRISAPIMSNAAIRTSRSVAGAVPVVGDAFTAAVDTVVHFSQAARSGVLVALVIVLCLAVAAPLIKIFVMSLVYRGVAAFLAPIADKRLITLLDSIGKNMGMLFNAAALVGVTCIYAVVILLSF
ncbi:MAG: stage III sporulation protein AE [Defluviitaleaceae bacterium]|nr:stage III sporulation protein AE [Defluviitaleaceae bacterium]